MADRLLVVGGGTMGSGIAFVAARGGYDVAIVEPIEAARDRSRALLEREAERFGDREALERIRWAESIPERSDAMLAIEAVPERFDLKRDVLAALSAVLQADAVIATNTSSLSVGDLAGAATHPERVLGLHFFNPATRMELVEVVHAPQTAGAAVDRALEFAERVGKTPVVTADTPGFIVNRVARPYYLQSLRALEAGVASVAELDALARGVGFRMGPFELMDLIGLDVNLATTQSVYARTEAERLAPVATQQSMVTQGLLGRKSGAGFYEYRDGNPQRLDASPAPLTDERDSEELVAIVGYGGVADELAELLERRYARVVRVEHDELLDDLPDDATIVIDVGDGASDRAEIAERLDALLSAEAVLFVDAYATGVEACAQRLKHPERLVGYGILGSLEGQSAVEIVDSETVSDDALELAQEVFAAAGKGSVLVEDVPGLFLGRTVGSIVNEALVAVGEGVASVEDVDVALQLGANYPLGPIAWGREIGGARIKRILQRLADADGDEFAPHRSLWILDLPEEPAPEQVPG